MMTMHTLSTILLLATLGSAIASAVYWFKSAALQTDIIQEPAASITDAPEDYIQTAIVNMNYIRESMNKSCRLNKWAALWTGISALLSAITAVSGTL
jgi:hypothetical protein